MTAATIVVGTGLVQAKPDAKLDLIFCIDVTGSMVDDIAEVKTAASDIVDNIMGGVPDSRVAIVGYRDFGDATMFEDYSFSSVKSTIIGNINSLSVSGGDDWPEAVYEALIRAIDSENVGGWRQGVTKIVILMGDAPPHEAGETCDYCYPGRTCEYKYTISDVIAAAEAADPPIIFTIVIGAPPDNVAATKFEALATGTDGSSFTAATAADVPDVIQDAVEEAVKEAEEEAEGEELNWMLIIGTIIVVVVVIAAVYALSRRRAPAPPSRWTPGQ